MKKIVMSLGIIALIGASVAGGTVAYFNDTETSKDNILIAGALDLKVDSFGAIYNGIDVPGSNWPARDLTNEMFFMFDDVKPGDWGRRHISFHVENNRAWVCAMVANGDDLENDLIDPEAAAGDISMTVGELSKHLAVFAWNDITADEIYNPLLGETPLLPDGTYFSPSLVIPLADSTTGAPIEPLTIGHVSLAWCAGTQTVNHTTGEITCDGSSMGDEAQTDSFVADLMMYAEQHRNNPDFVCGGQDVPPVDLPDKVDIIFALDLTGSMSDEITRVKNEAATIMTNLKTVVSPTTNFRFGVVSYQDYEGSFDSTPCGSAYSHVYGLSGDVPFRIDQPLTEDTATVAGVISGLTLGAGGDFPQSYGRVFWEMQNSAGALGWRSDALKLLVNFGDDVPHDPDLNNGITSPTFSSPFDTGRDPGLNNTVCDGDDIDFQGDAIPAMNTQDVKLLHINSSKNTNHQGYWDEWAADTGGASKQINDDGTIPGGLDLTDVIVDLLGLL